MDEAGTARLLLGVNGADTTEAVIATMTGTVLGRGLGPASNHHRVGLENARQAVKTAIDRAIAQVDARRKSPVRTAVHDAGLADPTITAACFGLSGVDGPGDEALFSSWLKELGCKYKFLVCNDSELILSGGTPEGWGLALISGTGSICLGRTRDGRTARAGGWGHLIGDEGSGFRIATEALALATQAADSRRGGSPALLDAARGFFRIAEPKELLAVIYRAGTTPEDLAGFAIRVLDLASKNEPSARGIVERATQALAVHIDAVVEKLELKEPPLALGGRLMRISFKKMILAHVTRPLGPVTIVNDSAQGAIVTAQRLATRRA